MMLVDALLDPLAPLVFRRATVLRVTRPAERFVHMTLEGDALLGARFVPGDRLRLRIRGAGLRTYTPIEVGGGRVHFVGHLHGEGPGAAWLAMAREGGSVELLGPQRSIDGGALRGPAVVVGDETSLGLAAALQRMSSPGPEVILEASDPAGVLAVARTLGLTRLEVVPRGGLPDAVVRSVDAGATPVLTGRAASLQEVRRALRARGLDRGGFRRAYWAEGKRGLE